MFVFLFYNVIFPVKGPNFTFGRARNINKKNSELGNIEFYISKIKQNGTVNQIERMNK